MTYLHISIPALEDCINGDSYGEICVHCNACGRFDKSTQKECELKMYKEELQEQYNFDGWIKGFEEVQKKNIESNIKYFKDKIAELEEKRMIGYKFLEMDMVIETTNNPISAEDFTAKFINWIEGNNWYCCGGVKPVDENGNDWMGVKK